MADAIALFDDATHIPCKASAPVTGKRFVAVSGAPDANGNIQVAHAAAGAKVFGVAEFDSRVEDDHYVTVATVNSGLIMPVTAGAAVAVNASVVSDANGQAITAAGAAGTVQHAAGIAVSAAGAGGEEIFVLLSPHSVTV